MSLTDRAKHVADVALHGRSSGSNTGTAFAMPVPEQRPDEETDRVSGYGLCTALRHCPELRSLDRPTSP